MPNPVTHNNASVSAPWEYESHSRCGETAGAGETLVACRGFGASFTEVRGKGIGVKERDIDEAFSAAAEFTGCSGAGASTMTFHVHPGIKRLKPGVIAAERIPAASTQ
jgi:hypothetical protein